MEAWFRQVISITMYHFWFHRNYTFCLQLVRLNVSFFDKQKLLTRLGVVCALDLRVVVSGACDL